MWWGSSTVRLPSHEWDPSGVQETNALVCCATALYNVSRLLWFGIVGIMSSAACLSVQLANCRHVLPDCVVAA